MRTGQLECDLGVLDGAPGYVPDLIAAKREAEHGPFPPGVAARLATDIPRLRAELETAKDESKLADRPSDQAVTALHDLIIRTRLG